MNTDRLLDVLSTQLTLLQVSMENQADPSNFFDEEDEGFDPQVMLNTPRALIEDIVESSDISQIYLTGVLDGFKRLNSLNTTTHIHRKKALSILLGHKKELTAQVAALDRLANAISQKQSVDNVVSIKRDA